MWNWRHTNIISTDISPPARSPRDISALILSVVGLLSIWMVAPTIAGRWVSIILAALLAYAFFRNAAHATHITLLSLLWVSACLIPQARLWPFYLLAPLVAYGMTVALLPQLHRSLGWLRAGHFSPDVVLLVIATVIASSAALVAWVKFAEPDLRHNVALIPQMPFWMYPAAAIGFATVNATMEEVVFRGVMMEALDSALGESRWPVGIQAVSFGALHFLGGFPNGMWGFFMVLVYGIMLGVIRFRSKGILAPWITHVAADVTIFACVWAVLISEQGKGIP